MFSDTLVQFVETDTQTYIRNKITNYKTNRIKIRIFIACGYKKYMEKVVITVISENKLTSYVNLLQHIINFIILYIQY